MICITYQLSLKKGLTFVTSSKAAPGRTNPIFPPIPRRTNCTTESGVARPAYLQLGLSHARHSLQLYQPHAPKFCRRRSSGYTPGDDDRAILF